MSLVTLGFTGIDVFTRQSVISADRRAKVQNSIAYALAHMTKNIAKAINDPANPTYSNSPVTRTAIGSDTAIEIRIDSDKDGRFGAADKQIAYSYNSATYRLIYYPDYSVLGTNDTLSDKIVSDLSSTYVTYDNSTHYIQVNMTGRWNPSNTTVSPENPQLKMSADIAMPGATVH